MVGGLFARIVCCGCAVSAPIPIAHPFAVFHYARVCCVPYSVCAYVVAFFARSLFAVPGLRSSPAALISACPRLCGRSRAPSPSARVLPFSLAQTSHPVTATCRAAKKRANAQTEYGMQHTFSRIVEKPQRGRGGYAAHTARPRQTVRALYRLP